MTIPASTRAFSLADAKAGAPIIQRDGTPARFIAHEPELGPYAEVIYISDKHVRYASVEGIASHSAYTSYDLLMAPPPLPETQYPETAMTEAELHDAFTPKIDNVIWNSKTARNIANAAIRHAIDNGQVPTKEAYAQCAADLAKAERSLELAGYTDCGGKLWKPPLGKLRLAARDIEVAEKVRSKCLHCFGHQDTPVAKLIAGLDLPALIDSMKAPA